MVSGLCPCSTTSKCSNVVIMEQHMERKMDHDMETTIYSLEFSVGREMENQMDKRTGWEVATG